LLAGADGAVMPMAGGQPLLVLIGLRMTMIDTLVDVSRLPDLSELPGTWFDGMSVHQ
jgi:CO/xanthine dehydrogenase FAD-binding subunit